MTASERGARHPWSRAEAVAVLAAALLGACSSPLAQPSPTDSSATTGSSAASTPALSGTTPAVTSDASSASPVTGPSGTAAPTTVTASDPASTSSAIGPLALPTSLVPLDKVLRDPDLGHEVKVLRLARELPWPPAQADEARSLELVAVEMTWTPGVTYTATLRTVDFSLGTSSGYPNRPDAILNAGLQAAGWSLLPAELATGQTGTGWVVFRVEPKGAAALRLDYTRPASRVTDSGQTFPKTVFSAQLLG